VIVQLPQRVGLELKGQRDERQDPADDMVVCVFCKGFDFGYEGGGSLGMLRGGMSERLALEVVMLVVTQMVSMPLACGFSGSDRQTSILSGTPPSLFQIP
jgi:hypothetical protein